MTSTGYRVGLRLISCDYLRHIEKMSKFNIDDPLGLDEMLAKECVICNEKDHPEDILETPEGFAHRICLDEQAIDYAEESEENNKKLEI